MEVLESSWGAVLGACGVGDSEEAPCFFRVGVACWDEEGVVACFREEAWRLEVGAWVELVCVVVGGVLVRCVAVEVVSGEVVDLVREVFVYNMMIDERTEPK
jgi:hypothetical protein